MIQQMTPQEFGGWIYEKKFIPTQIGLSSRLVSYWKTKKLLPFMVKEKKGLMNIPEALWLLIVNELMQIGLSTKKVEELTHQVWIKPFEEKYADKVFETEINNPKSTLTQNQKNSLKNFLEHEAIMSQIFRREINPFTDKIKDCLKNKRELLSFIYCPSSGKHLWHSASKSLINNLNNIYNQETFISIPIVPLLSKLIGLEISSSKEDLAYLNQMENQIRRTLVYDKPKSIEIQILDKEKSKTFIITEQHKKANELANFFLNNKLPLKSSIIITPRSQGNFKITIKSES